MTAALAEAPQYNAVPGFCDAEADRRLLEASFDAEAAEDLETALRGNIVELSSSQV